MTIFDGITFALYGGDKRRVRRGIHARSKYANRKHLRMREYILNIKITVYTVKRSPDYEQKDQSTGMTTQRGGVAYFFWMEELCDKAKEGRNQAVTELIGLDMRSYADRYDCTGRFQKITAG